MVVIYVLNSPRAQGYGLREGASLLLQRLFVHSTVTEPMGTKECVQCVHWLAVGDIFILFFDVSAWSFYTEMKIKKHVCEADIF